MNRHENRHPLAWLGKQSSFQDLTLHASRLAELQKLLEQCSPIKGLVVRSLDQSILSVSAPNASSASKFRQFEPTVLRTLTERGWKVIRIRIRPQLYADNPPQSAAERRAKPEFPECGLESLRALLRSGVDTRIESALTRLLARHDSKGARSAG